MQQHITLSAKYKPDKAQLYLMTALYVMTERRMKLVRHQRSADTQLMKSEPAPLTGGGQPRMRTTNRYQLPLFVYFSLKFLK